jgi:Flp pilus assembly protein TadG
MIFSPRHYLNQKGTTSVEFAIVGLLVFIVLFGAIEMGRMLFTLNTLREATYRGARMAAICTIGNPAIARVAIFNAAGTGSTSSILPNLTTSNIQVEYLNNAGTVLASPAIDLVQFASIRFVRVQIVNYTHDFFLPGANISFITRSYPATLRSESLGIAPAGQTTTCT